MEQQAEHDIPTNAVLGIFRDEIAVDIPLYIAILIQQIEYRQLRLQFIILGQCLA
jgi:hypothetical protein